MKVINIFGGAGIGKTTQGCGLMYNMKMLGYNVEYIPEYAKTLIYQNNSDLKENQIDIFANQYKPYRYLKNNVDYAIAESPFILGCVYNRRYNLEDNPHFDDFLLYEFNKFNNINILLKRETEYDTNGRYQTLSESSEIDSDIEMFLNKHKIKYTTLGLDNFVENVIKML